MYGERLSNINISIKTPGTVLKLLRETFSFLAPFFWQWIIIFINNNDHDSIMFGFFYSWVL